MSDSVEDQSTSEPEQKPVVQSAKKNKRKMKQKKGKPASPQKKAKTESPKTPAIVPKDSSDESDSGVAKGVPEGTILDLGRNCHVRVNTFRGKTYLDFRGYYQPKGTSELKPGNKGISLLPEQWITLTQNISVLNKALANAPTPK